MTRTSRLSSLGLCLNSRLSTITYEPPLPRSRRLTDSVALLITRTFPLSALGICLHSRLSTVAYKLPFLIGTQKLSQKFSSD